ncbi:DUF2244 domain-containing protein [Polynucleobacter paneuropaeus]|nr:DUF2244 domain-containing protein [Polynucleobacter paneuropaeus]
MKTWRMKRNCALTPKQLFQFYAVLVFFSLLVGIGFLIAGVWVIIIFTCIELCALTLGFLIYARHALDFEEIQIDGTVLKITKFIGSKTKEYKFNSRWTQVLLPRDKPKIFVLSSENHNIELGQFVRQDQMPQIISEIKSCLG